MSSKGAKGPKIIVVCHNETQVNELVARHLVSAHGGEQGHGRPTGDHETMKGEKRTWDAGVGARLYKATSTAGGVMQITLNNVVVWAGRRLAVGEYQAKQNAIPERELSKVLELLRAGDQRLGGDHVRAPVPPRTPAAPPARTRTKAEAPTRKEPKRAKPKKGMWQVHVSLKGMEGNPIATYPFDTEGEAHAFAKTKREELAQHPGSLVVTVKGGKAAKKPKQATTPKASTETPVAATLKRKPGRPKKAEAQATAAASTPVAATPKRKPGRPKKAETQATAAASDKPASPKPAKAPRKRRAATSTTAASGPPTTRSSRSAQVTPEEMRRRLAEKNPETPANVLEMFEDIWRGGASEPVQAWMMANTIDDTAAAFVDWVNHHDKQANAFWQAGKAQRAA